MKKTLFATMILVLAAASLLFAGSWGTYEFMWRPSLGDKGSASYNLFDSALVRADKHMGAVKILGDPNYSTLSEALATIDTDEVTLKLPSTAGAIAVTSNTTIPANITLVVDEGAYFNISDGVTLYCQAGILAGHYKIFQWSGTGKIYVCYTKNPVASFAWWGPPEGISNDCTAHFKRAVEGMTKMNTMFIPMGVWRITSTIDWEDLDGTPGGNCTQLGRLVGAGQRVSYIYIDVGASNNGIEFGTDETGYALYDLYLRDLSFVGPASSCLNGVVFKKCHGMDIDRVNFWMDADEYAVVVQGCCVSYNPVNLSVQSDSNGAAPDNGVKLTRNPGDSYAINWGQYRIRVNLTGTGNSTPYGLYIDGEEDYATGQWNVGHPLEISACIENCGNGYPIYAEYCRRTRFHNIYATDGNNKGPWFQGCRNIDVEQLHCDGTSIETLFDNCQNVTLTDCDLGILKVKANCQGFNIGDIELTNEWGLKVETGDVTWIGSVLRRDDAAFPRHTYNVDGPNRQNYMHNTGFDRWQSEPPDGWSDYQSDWVQCGVGKADTTRHLLDFCAKVTTNGGATTLRYDAVLNAHLLKFLPGQQVTWTIWCKPAAGMDYADGATNHPYIRIDTTSPTWTSSTEYFVGDYVQSTGATKWFRCITAGTSGGTEPSWDTGWGRKTTDGTVTWQKVHAQPESRSCISYPLTDAESGKWTRLACSGFIPRNATAIQFQIYNPREADSSEGTCYWAEPMILIGPLGATGHIMGHDEHLDYVMVGGRKLSWGSAAPTSGWWDEGDLRISTSQAAGAFVGWVCDVAGSPGTWRKFGSVRLAGSTTWDPPDLADGVGATCTGFTVTGAALGDFVMVSAPYDLEDCIATAYVQAADTVEIRLQNESGAARNGFGSGTWRVRVFKQGS